jgi:hypothetical protein
MKRMIEDWDCGEKRAERGGDIPLCQTRGGMLVSHGDLHSTGNFAARETAYCDSIHLSCPLKEGDKPGVNLS